MCFPLGAGSYLVRTSNLYDRRFEVTSLGESKEFCVIHVMTNPFKETHLFSGASGSDSEH